MGVVIIPIPATSTNRNGDTNSDSQRSHEHTRSKEVQDETCIACSPTLIGWYRYGFVDVHVRLSLFVRQPYLVGMYVCICVDLHV